MWCALARMVPAGGPESGRDGMASTTRVTPLREPGWSWQRVVVSDRAKGHGEPGFGPRLAIRVNDPKAWVEHPTIDWVFTDLAHTYRLELTNGVLIQHVDPAAGTADLTLTLTKPQLLSLLGGGGLDGLTSSGDPSVVARLLAVLDPPNPGFAIVTP